MLIKKKNFIKKSLGAKLIDDEDFLGAKLIDDEDFFFFFWEISCCV
jgi:hypothetical protein